MRIQKAFTSAATTRHFYYHPHFHEIFLLETLTPQYAIPQKMLGKPQFISKEYYFWNIPSNQLLVQSQRRKH